MGLKNLHLVCTYLLLCLGTTILWLGEATEETPPYPIVVIFFALASYAYTDRLGMFRFSGLVSNIFGLLVMGIVFLEYRLTEQGILQQDILVVLAHLLVYLQVIMCFREKHERDFWLLYLINLLQVVVGNVESGDVSVGLLLLGYCLMAIWTLTIFQLSQHHERIVRDERGPLRQEPGRKGRVRSLGFQAAIVTIVSFTVAIPIAFGGFWLIPRSAKARTRPLLGVGTDDSETGFSNSVHLDEMKRILVSNEVALNVWARDSEGNEVRLPEDMLWRGSVFTRYENKEWKGYENNYDKNRSIDWQEEPELPKEYIELEVERTLHTGKTLFCPQPIYWAGTDAPNVKLWYNPLENRLNVHFRGERRDPRLSYRLYTKVPDPAAMVSKSDSFQPDPRYLSRQCKYLPNGLTRLRQKAQELTRDLEPEDSLGKIHILENYLSTSGEFGYTLDLEPQNPRIDPIEDFLFESKSGHCEYFASALALMLRSVDVPTRIVNGFKGVEYNETTGYYQVRELLAHCWVEAYLFSDEGGYWLTLDPTPYDLRAEELARVRTWLQPILDFFYVGKRFWENHIVRYGILDQQKLGGGLQAVLSAEVFEPIEQVTQRLSDRFRSPRSPTSSKFWLRWQGAVLAVWLLIGCFGLYKSFCWLRRIFVGGLHTRFEHRRRIAKELPVYEHWLGLLERRGLIRQPSQTPREFALQIGQRCRADPHVRSWADLPLVLTEVFYAVHFGDHPSDPKQVRKLEEQVQLFEQAVRF